MGLVDSLAQAGEREPAATDERGTGGSVTHVTIIDERPTTVDAVVDPERAAFLLTGEQMETAVGWKLTAAGLCRGDVCVPLSRRETTDVDRQHDRVDLTDVTAALGRSVVVDPDSGIAAVARPSEARRRVLRDLVAPDLELPGLDGRSPPARRVAGTEATARRLRHLVRMLLRPARMAGAPR